MAKKKQPQVTDWIYEVWQTLFIKHWDYQSYSINPITPSGWKLLTKEINDKAFLRNLGRYKEKKNIFEIVYYFVTDLIKKHSS